MAQEINIKLNVQTGDANQTVGQFKVNIEQVGDAVDKTVQKTSKMNSSLSSTSKRIKGLGLEDASRGIERLGTGFSSLKLSNITSGFRMLGAAIASNPIGAIATAVLALVNAFGGLQAIIDFITAPIKDLFAAFNFGASSIDAATQALDSYNNKLDEVNNTATVTNAMLEAEIKIMEAQGKTAEEIADKRKQLLNDQLDQTIQQQKVTADYIAQLKFLQSEERKNSEKYVEYQGKINAAIKEVQSLKAQGIKLDAEIRASDIKTEKQKEDNAKKEVKKVVDIDKVRSNAFKNLQERYKKEIEILENKNFEEENLLKKSLIDGEITEEEFNRKKLELNIKLNEQLKAQLENFILTEKEIKSIGAQNELIFREQLNDDKRKQEASYLDSILALNKNNDAKLKAEEAKRLKDEQDEKKKTEDKLKSDIQSFENDFIKKKIDLLRSSNITEQELIFRTGQAEIDKMMNIMNLYKEGSAERLKLQEEIAVAEKKLADDKTEYIKKKNQEELEDSRKTQDASFALASASLSSLSTLNDIFFQNKRDKAEKGSKEEEKLARKQFEINKALQLGTAVINGIQSILAITSVPDFTLGIQSALRIGAQVALNAASIAKIASQKFSFDGGAAGGSSTPSLPSAPTAQAPTFQPTQFFGLGQTTPGLGGQEQGPTRVYVTEGDISNTQNRVRVVENRARFG